MRPRTSWAFLSSRWLTCVNKPFLKILFSNSYQILKKKIMKYSTKKSISDSLSCVSISFGKMKSSMQRWVHCVHKFYIGWAIVVKEKSVVKRKKKQFCTVAGKKTKTHQMCAMLFRQLILFKLFYSFCLSSPLFYLKASINTQWNSGLQSTNHLKW